MRDPGDEADLLEPEIKTNVFTSALLPKKIVSGVTKRHLKQTPRAQRIFGLLSDTTQFHCTEFFYKVPLTLISVETI